MTDCPRACRNGQLVTESKGAAWVRFGDELTNLDVPALAISPGATNVLYAAGWIYRAKSGSRGTRADGGVRPTLENQVVSFP